MIASIGFELFKLSILAICGLLIMVDWLHWRITK